MHSIRARLSGENYALCIFVAQNGHYASLSCMRSIDDILTLWPSMADLGRDLGVPYSTVAAWKQRGSIPVTYWRGLTDAARSRGLRDVTSELLVELHDPKAAGSGSGLSEPSEAAKCDGLPAKAGAAEAGQFSTWKPLRRTHFASTEEIVDHVRALRSEWDRR